MKFSIVIPVLNEVARLQEQLQRLQPVRRQGHELIVVDGGSDDGSVALAGPLVDRLVHSDRGRARQMNIAAASADGDVLVFLHCDTELPAHALDRLERALETSDASWGWFDVRLSNPAWPYRLIAWSMNRRARLTRVCTGDQTLFVRQDQFRQLGGFPAIALMEDIAMSKLLRRCGRPCVMGLKVETSSRRWEEQGILRTILLMWRLRLLYFLGVSPGRLVRRYYPERRWPEAPNPEHMES